MTQPPGASPDRPEPVPPPGHPSWPRQNQPPPAQYPGYQPYPPGYAPGQQPQPQYPQPQYPQPQYPQPRAAETPGMRARLWLLLTLPFGLTTWAAFLYTGIRAGRKRWLAWALLYALGTVAFLVLSTNNSNSPREGVAVGVMLLTWIGGGIHALAVSGDAARRIHGPGDPALEAARMRIQRRAQGRHLLASQPALAKEIGLGRPDVDEMRDMAIFIRD